MKETFKSKNGYTYHRIKKKDMPKWVLKKYWKAIKKDEDKHLGEPVGNKNFYFKGEKYRYLVRTLITSYPGGTSSYTYDVKRKFYKRKRGKKK